MLGIQAQKRLNGKRPEELLCQCRKCLDQFSVEALTEGHHLLEVEHIRLRSVKGYGLRHYCGGEIAFFSHF